MPESQRVSVAPMKGQGNKCPGCGEYTAYYDALHQSNTCTRDRCDFWERVTEDHKPRKFTEAEVRQIVVEAVNQHVQGFHGGPENLPMR